MSIKRKRWQKAVKKPHLWSLGQYYRVMQKIVDTEFSQFE